MKTKSPRFSRDQLIGMWSALPTPWKRNGQLDQKIYRADIERCCKAGMHGLYSGGTTGEFYVQDFGLFCEINEVLIETAHRFGKPVQAGCTALDTAEARKRIRRARQLGADLVQIALPFWLELDDEETMDFFRAVADEAGPTPIVHYDTGRAKRRISPALYQAIRKRVPTLWGTKFGGADLFLIGQITLANPDLKLFVGEVILASATPLGATGCYSALVNASPSWMLDYFEACRNRNWERAFAVQDQVRRLLSMLNPKLQDTALDRVFGQLAGFLKCPLHSKPPYRSATQADLAQMRLWARKVAPEIFEPVVCRG